MSMDPIYIEAILCELRTSVRGAAVSKIYQTGPSDFLFKLWNGRENRLLLLSAAPRASRLYLSGERLPTPATPPRFCQLLRSRLRRLLAVERVSGERIVRFLFAGEGDQRWTLVAELLGPHANLILLDTQGEIVDALRRREEAGRSLLSGSTYRPPAAPARAPLEGALPASPGRESFAAWLLANVAPMTPLLAADLEAAATAGVPPEAALRRLAERWRSRDFRPCITRWQGRKILTALPPEYLELADARFYTTPSQAAEAFYAATAEEELFAAGKPELERVVRRALTRLQKRLVHIAAEADRSGDYERQRQFGDLLLANLHRLQRGMSEALLEDWYAEPPAQVRIPLQADLSPQENAEACFRRHRKGKRAVEHIARRTAETSDEIEWLEGVALALEDAAGSTDLEAIRQELAAAGILQVRPEPGRIGRPVALEEQVRRAVTPCGYLLFWGKNNRGNDHVSRQLTDADDLWFHAHNLPGAHLVLKRGGRGGDVPETEILFAAAIAAAYSRGRDAAKVEVMVASGRSVRRPKGARPGLVTVERFRTVVVRPQADHLPEREVAD